MGVGLQDVAVLTSLSSEPVHIYIKCSALEDTLGHYMRIFLLENS